MEGTPESTGSSIASRRAMATAAHRAQQTVIAQVRMLYANGGTTVVTAAIAALVFTTLLYPVAPRPALTIWFGCGVVVLGSRIVALVLYHRSNPTRWQDWERWRRLWLAGIAASGLVWGASVVWLFPADAPITQLSMALVLIMLCAGAASLYSSIQGAYLLAMVPIGLPLIVQFLRQGDLTMQMLGLLMLLFLLGTARISWSTARLFSSLQKLRHNNEELSYRASHDPLVELPNQREFRQRLAKAAERVDREHEHYAVLYIDLDGFKEVNDCYGHETGDELLKRIGEVLRARVRSTDTAARLGGDEFAVLLSPCPRDQAVRIAESIRDDIANLTAQVAGLPRAMSLSASIGVAYSHDADHSPASMMRAADAACYAAKRGGRNRVMMHGADAETSPSGRFVMLTTVDSGD